MHITILSIGDEYGESRLNDHVGLELDYIKPITEDEKRPETCVKTVEDVRNLTNEELLSYGMLEENGALYDNPFDIMTPEQVLQMYITVLCAYEDSTPVQVFDAHI